MEVTARYFACHRGADKHGVRGDTWFLLHENPLSLEDAMKECQGWFESGLFYRPAASEFRIIQQDGVAVYESTPPHGATLQWQPVPR